MSRAQLTSTVEQNTGGAVAPFVAGKNKIINGDFNIWQRGIGFTAAGGNLCADRMIYNAGTTPTVSQQPFAFGDISGYNPQFFLRFVKGNTTADALSITQRIEDVRTFAGQTVTLSFWARSSAAFTNAPLTRQVFGSGGSSDVYTTYTTQSITTSWARYSMTFTMPSISGQTLGAGSFVDMYFIRFTGTTNITVDVWGVQLEAGSVATPFTTATGTLSGELAACQRYFQRFGQVASKALYNTAITSTVESYGVLPFLVEMRTAPSISASSGTAFSIYSAAGAKTPTAFGASNISTKAAVIQFNSTGFTAGQAGTVSTDATTNGYIDLSAEL